MKSTVAMDDLEFEVTYTYSPATPDVWYLRNGDPGYPGDPAEADIEKITLWGIDVTMVIPEDVFDRLYDLVCEKAEEEMNEEYYDEPAERETFDEADKTPE